MLVELVNRLVNVSLFEWVVLVGLALSVWAIDKAISAILGEYSKRAWFRMFVPKKPADQPDESTKPGPPSVVKNPPKPARTIKIQRTIYRHKTTETVVIMEYDIQPPNQPSDSTEKRFG